MWKKLIQPGEKVGLELTQTERKLLLTGLVFLHEDVEAAIRSTPPGGVVCDHLAFWSRARDFMYRTD